MDNLIVIEQYPVITERLQEISAEAQKNVSAALALDCTDENIQTVKKARATLRKEFDELETSRKEVDRLISEKLKPFNDAYKAYITDVYVPADNELKSRIDALETEKKEIMRKEVEDYFNEYALSKGIDFVAFDKANIKANLSDTVKKLKAQAKEFLDRICDDLALIETQEYKAEILVEYKNTLNASLAITSVTARHKAIEKERERQAAAEQLTINETAAVEKVETALSAAVEVDPMPLPPRESPVENPTLLSPTQRENQILRTNFSVWGTREQLKAVKQFLIDGGYRYE